MAVSVDPIALARDLINESDSDCSFVVVGGGTNTGGGYSDIDMMFTADNRYVHKDGLPY